METSIEPLVVSSFSLGSSSRTALSFPARLAITASAPAIAAPKRFRGDWRGGAGGGGAGAGEVSICVLIRYAIVAALDLAALKRQRFRPCSAVWSQVARSSATRADSNSPRGF